MSRAGWGVGKVAVSAQPALVGRGCLLGKPAELNTVGTSILNIRLYRSNVETRAAHGRAFALRACRTSH